MSDIIVNVTEWMEENIDADFDPGEREALAYFSLAMTKMYLMGETSHQWSEKFTDYLAELKDNLDGFIE